MSTPLRREALGGKNDFAEAKPYPESRLAEIRVALADIKGLEVRVS